jgi:hypothetical protein
MEEQPAFFIDNAVALGIILSVLHVRRKIVCG